MFPRWWRLGIRPQLTIIVIMGAILSTVATLFIADNAIKNYVITQAQTQERTNSNIALLVLHNNYGANISISADGKLVADSPNSVSGVTVTVTPNNTFGRFVLNDDTDYVDSVKHLVNADVSLFQCANSNNVFTQCVRIATTFIKPGTTSVRDTGEQLRSTVNQGMQLGSATPQEWLGQDNQDGVDYYSDYTPIFNGQHQLVGVLAIEVPLDTINSVINRTTVELILIGTIIMIAGIILALFFANTIITALQRAARQVNTASERIGTIAVQQSSGAAQQVWAINAINQALQNFSDTAKDISQRTDQLALMGNQVLQRRGEIPPGQIDSILAYMTRSVRDISASTRQQAAQYERMTGAMQAVIEIAEQVSGSAQQSTESAERLELVVRQLQQVVGVRLANRGKTNAALDAGGASTGDLAPSPASQNKMKGTVRSVRPDRKKQQERAAAMAGAGGAMGMNAQMGLGGMGQMGGMGQIGGMASQGNMGQMGMMQPMGGMGMGQSNMGQMGQMGGMATGRASGNRMGGMGQMGQMGQMGGMGQRGPNTNQGSWQSGGLDPRQMRGGMSGGMGQMGGNYGGYGNGNGNFGGYDNMGVEDWRLPPLPDLELPMGWDAMASQGYNQGYNSLPPQDPMGNGPRSGQPGRLLPPQRVPGRGNNRNGPDRSNQGGGW